MKNYEPTLTLRATLQASKKLLAVLVATSILLVLGLWLISPTTITQREHLWVVSIFTAIIVLANLLFGIHLYLRPWMGILQLSQDALYISVPNLTLNVRSGPRQLRWDQIHCLEINRIWGKPYIAIGLHSKNSSIDLWRRFCSGTVADVAIPDIFEPTPADLLALMNDYRDNYLKRQPPAGAFQPIEK